MVRSGALADEDADGGSPAGRALELGKQVATLVFAATAPLVGATAVGQAIACRNALARLGYEPPLFVVYDLQRLLSGGAPPSDAELARVPGRGGWDRRTQELFARYVGLLRGLVSTPAFEHTARRPLPVEYEAVLIARLLVDAYRRWVGAGVRPSTGAPLPTAGSSHSTPADLAVLHDPSWCLGFMSAAATLRDFVVARAEQLDLGPLRLLGLFSGSAPANLLDLYNLMGSAAGGRAVEFSLQLLPSVLETKRSTASQRFSIDGYSSVERRGSLDAILPSELAHDEDTFAHKVLSDELLYYGHERRAESILREHWVLVDASASMRGLREVCARGLAVALCKKLSLQGDSVSFRFFDSRLHRRIPVGAAGGHDLPHILSFRSEHGRHYARVFDDLLNEARRGKRRGGRDLAITFITHGECHIPAALVEGLAQVAQLYGVFVLPSRPLALTYLPLLHKHQILTTADFANADARKRRALDILQDVSRAHA
ncbi:MAG: hypothetical protein SF187_18450 [Deltaproteobacteria bacterium]|nr:hypothetical protein [Deltaproteobacteria bacterium]